LPATSNRKFNIVRKYNLFIVVVLNDIESFTFEKTNILTTIIVTLDIT